MRNIDPSGPPLQLSAIVVLAACLCLLAGNCAAKDTPDEVLATFQKIYLRNTSRQMDKLLSEMEGRKDIHQADRNFTSITVPSPSGRWILLVLSRVRPEPKDRWIVLALDSHTLETRLVFDFIRAFGMQRIRWLDDRRFLLQTRGVNLSGPPGELYYFDLSSGTAKLVDDLVWRFTVSGSLDDLVYERSDREDRPYDVRRLYLFRLPSGEKTEIRRVRHPRVQFGGIGPFAGDDSFFRYRVDSYGSDSFEPRSKWFWYDLMTGKNIEGDGKSASPLPAEAEPQFRAAQSAKTSPGTAAGSGAPTTGKAEPGAGAHKGRRNDRTTR